MSHKISYEELVREIEDTKPDTVSLLRFKPVDLHDGLKTLHVRARSMIPLAGVLQKNNGAATSGVKSAVTEILIGYATPGDYIIRLKDGVLYVCLDNSGQSLFRIASTATFDELLDERKRRAIIK